MRVLTWVIAGLVLSSGSLVNATAANVASVERSLETAAVHPGDAVLVSVAVNASQALVGFAVEEQVPLGWSVEVVDNGSAAYRATAHQWLWKQLPAASIEVVKYRLRAPLNAVPGVLPLSGNYSSSTFEPVPIGGASQVTVQAVVVGGGGGWVAPSPVPVVPGSESSGATPPSSSAAVRSPAAGSSTPLTTPAPPSQVAPLSSPGSATSGPGPSPGEASAGNSSLTQTVEPVPTDAAKLSVVPLDITTVTPRSGPQNALESAIASMLPALDTGARGSLAQAAEDGSLLAIVHLSEPAGSSMSGSGLVTSPEAQLQARALQGQRVDVDVRAEGEGKSVALRLDPGVVRAGSLGELAVLVDGEFPSLSPSWGGALAAQKENTFYVERARDEFYVAAHMAHFSEHNVSVQRDARPADRVEGLRLDAEPPRIRAVSFDPAVPIARAWVRVAVQAEDDTAVASVRVNDQPLAFVSGGWVGVLQAPIEGPWSMVVQAKDEAGNVAYVNQSLGLSAASPLQATSVGTLTIDQVVVPRVVGMGRGVPVRVTTQGDAPVLVMAAGVPLQFVGGAWVGEVPALALPASGELTVTALDAAGQQVQSTARVMVDSSEPWPAWRVASRALPGTQWVVDAAVPGNLSAWLYLDGVVVARALPWRVDPGVLGVGIHSLSLVVQNEVGNVAGASLQFTVDARGITVSPPSGSSGDESVRVLSPSAGSALSSNGTVSVVVQYTSVTPALLRVVAFTEDHVVGQDVQPVSPAHDRVVVVPLRVVAEEIEEVTLRASLIQ